CRAHGGASPGARRWALGARGDGGLCAQKVGAKMSDRDTQWPRFEVFQQVRPDTPFHNVGSVHAPDAELALQNARDVFVRRPQTVTLWVVPADRILMKTREELAAEPGWRDEIP